MKFSFDLNDFIALEEAPDKLALVDQYGELSWTGFRNSVLEFEAFIRKNELDQTNKPIVVYGHKDREMVIAIYALIKLQIAYIPVDEIYPQERIRHIIDETETPLIINTTGHALDFAQNLSVLDFHGSEFKLNSPQHFVPEERFHHPDPLVYIIFTSGSTGKPKGVQISTEAVQSFTSWMCNDFSFTDKDVFINTAILSFDLSVFELLTFAALGATLVLTPKELISVPKNFAEYVQKNRGTILVSTPSFVLPFARLQDLKEFDTIRHFLFCGEVLPHMTASNLISNFPNARVLNTYGPTEATVATTLVEITQDILNTCDSLPVGSCKPGTELQILDGEIVIIGPNVSVGYFKNEELNQTKFKTIGGQRAFFTGDIGYFEGGQLFFNGRNDDLVKLHGYRIELNEINETIARLPYISHAATIPLKRDNAVKKIVSLVVLMPGNESVNSTQIKEDLAKSLPPYMVPGDIKITARIPLNANGKADKTALTKMYLGGS